MRRGRDGACASSVMTILLIAIGGAFGAPIRFLVDRFVADRFELDFPLGTFMINMSGSFMLGLLTGLDLAGRLPIEAKSLVAVGFCGAYTTFSTWSYETVRLLEAGEIVEAVLNVCASLLLGVAAAGAGLALGLLGG